MLYSIRTLRTARSYTLTHSVVEIGATQESPLLWILLALELEVMVVTGVDSNINYKKKKIEESHMRKNTC